MYRLTITKNKTNELVTIGQNGEKVLESEDHYSLVEARHGLEQYYQEGYTISITSDPK